MLDKIYKEEDKFGNTGNNFNFKVTIFYNRYRRISLLSNVYIHNSFIILSDQAHKYYYVNYSNIFIFHQYCINM